ncbi:ABC transporter permease [Mesorhizobium sp. M1088]|uniref:ABC transporter permease n=1 Tax=Mesorhizobium sp. M1088 TaxID=2957056 RepID=UPI003336C1C1
MGNSRMTALQPQPFSRLALLVRNPTTIQRAGLLFMTLLILTFMQAAYPGYVSAANMEVLAMNMVFEAIIAVGMTFVIISGGIDLSVAAVFAFAEILVAKLMVQAGLPIGAAIPITLVACGMIGLANGLLINLLRVHPLIVTLATLLTMRGVNLSISSGKSIAGFDDAFLFVGQGKLVGVPLPIWALVILTAGLGFLLRNHRSFRQVYFVGSDERAARLSGVNVERVKLVVYTASAILAGFAGVLAASRYGAAHWGHGNMAELKAIAAVAIGGANINGGSGSLGGTLMGILFLATVHNAFVTSAVNTFLYDVVNGGMLLVAILLSRYFEARSNVKILSIRQKKISNRKAILTGVTT